jgi:hypothetical protein
VVEVDLFEFIKTGRFDYVELGQTKEHIRRNFCAPDDASADDAIWRYGGMEFFFDETGRLYMIFADGFRGGEIRDGENLKLRNLWRFKKPIELDPVIFMRALLAEGMDFSVAHKPELNKIECFITQSGVTLDFDADEENEKNPEKYKCDALWLSDSSIMNAKPAA